MFFGVLKEYQDARLQSMTLFTKISGTPKWHKSGAGVQESLKFLSSALFMCLASLYANNSHGGRVYVKKIASQIFITYIVVALPATRCASGAHRKGLRMGLCHTVQSGQGAI